MIDNPRPSVPCDAGTRKPRAIRPALPLWDPRIEPIPGVPRAYWVWSETDPGVRYTCNLDAMACACADSTFNRQDLDIDSPLRACKHLVSAADLEATVADARAWERQQHADADQSLLSLPAPTTLICASCGHEAYALVDDGICAACSFFDDGSRPFRQLAQEAQATAQAAPLPEPIPLIRERRCPDCDGPSADGYIYCAVNRFGHSYCARTMARREERV